MSEGRIVNLGIAEDIGINNAFIKLTQSWRLSIISICTGSVTRVSMVSKYNN